MAENHTFLHRIRDKISKRPASPRTSDSPLAARPCRPSTQHLPPASLPLTIPNPLPPADLLSYRDECIAEATSSVHPGTVNVVGHDQTNVTHFHMNFNTPESVAHPGSGNTEKPLLHPLFDKLSHVVKASYDASTPAPRRACTENTRTAVLKAVLDWAFDPTMPNIYWLNGMAGTGKTTIAYSLSIALESYNTLMATFFCSRLVDECTKVDRIFPTIAFNLAQNHALLASTILEVLENDPDIASRALNQQFTELLMMPTGLATKNLAGKPIVVIIDALDECANQTEVQTLLSILFRRSSELFFKILITSRPEQVVRVGFNRHNPDNYSKLILHDIDRNIVNADIKLYLVERLVEMVDGRSDFQESGDDWPADDKVDILSRQANGLFIYAKTVCDYIGEPGGNILANLNNATHSREDPVELSGDALDTSELDRLYRDILDRAIPIRPKARDNLRQILSAIVSIRNPLSAHGLGMLLDIDPGMIKSALGSLHSVITVPQSLDAPISTFHASFPDCLAEPTRSLQHHIPPSQSHEMLAKGCLSLMNSSLKENICNLGQPANDTIANEMISTHIPKGLAYACMYWASHLSGTGKDEIQSADDVRQLLDEFLHNHILHWIECLSLLRQLRVAVESLRMIEEWVLNIFQEMSPVVTDARRFVVENFELINGYCLETYHSALVWLPVQSIIRQQYATQKPDLPRVTLGLRNNWGSCERIIICESEVNSVSFSSDGRHVVSGSDATVQIWNAATGELEGVFEGHSDGVTSVAFSSDSSHVVSGSYDKTIRIWVVVTDKEEAVFEGHSGGVMSVAFSNDSSRVVSGSLDRTVRIWNAATGESEGILEGHSGGVISVAFSSDGSRVVSGSSDKTIRIWNAVTGELERFFEGHTAPVWSVAFSSDGSQVVSGSHDKTVRVWNAATGEEGVFKGHSERVISVAFSSDKSKVVSGSLDTTVRVWDAVTGESKVFNGHLGKVTSVAFMSNGSHIVSGSSDKTIRIWNIAVPGESLFEGHSGMATSVAFSSDGSRVVSGSVDSTVRIWNSATGKEEGVFIGHLGRVISVAFSNDDSMVVSGSRDDGVRIWDTATGEARVLDPFSVEVVRLSDQTEIQKGYRGSFTISTVDCDHRPRPLASCFLSDDKAWIRTDSLQQSCWIPERYRGFTCTHSCGPKMAFGFTSGNVVIVDLG